MNKWLLPVLLTVVFSSSNVLAEETLRIGTEGAYPPYNMINDDGKLVGFEMDLGNVLCERLEMTCEFVANDWDSIIPNLLAGNYDVIMAGMSITDERKETIGFSDEYKPVDPSLYLAAKDTQLDFENLTGKSIGVQGGTIQEAYAKEKLGEKNTIKSYDKPDQSIADLAAGNLDAVLADGEFIRTAADGSQGELVIVGPGEMIGGGFAIGLRQDATELTEKLNKALTAIKEDGTLDTLIEEYFQAGPFYTKAEPAEQ